MTETKPVSALIRVLIYILIAFVASSCSTKKERKLERGGLTLKYIDKTSRGSSTADYQMDHPLKIPDALLRAQLTVLMFEERSLMGKKKFIFQPEEIDEIGGLIAKGIRHLKPDSILFFEWDGPKGTTSADVFIVEQYIHWRFISIHGMTFSNSNLNRWGSSTWVMAPVKGQGFHVSDKFLGNKTNENWIISPLQLPVLKRRVSADNADSKTSDTAPEQSSKGKGSSTSDKGALEKKLEFLKDLRDKDLIDEKEYQRKRQELLDTLL
jgi:hypothetical protein